MDNKKLLKILLNKSAHTGNGIDVNDFGLQLPIDILKGNNPFSLASFRVVDASTEIHHRLMFKFQY
ncbi:hypothetical protein LCGC14_0787610 [marine sediment metagenome]|uniref:Uncharacterized protein n=1 Tax=marine sediment metagenome TaxID=412755 RepID=A0A0F9PTR5_9ZZZZ